MNPFLRFPRYRACSTADDQGRIEHEVRFAFAVDGVLLGVSSARGVLIEINPKELIESIDDVRISPHVLKDEAQVIQKLIERSLSENSSIDLSLDLSFPSAKLTEPFLALWLAS
jgi:hypothetical protein